MRTTARWIPILCTCAALVGCGGGGGTVAPAYDLTGYWQLWLTPTGSTTAVGPLAVYFRQDGATFDGVDVNGSISGSSFTLTADGGAFELTLNGSASSANAANGAATFTGSINGSGTFDLARFDPAGSFDAVGTLDGVAIDESAVTAIGIRTYSDEMLTVQSGVTVAVTDADIDLQLTFDPSQLAVGGLTVPGQLDVEILMRVDGLILSTSASSGSVTITAYDAAGIAGTFTLTTAVGSISGSFDVAFDIDEYSP